MIRRVSILTLLGLITGGVVGLLAVGFVDAVLWLNDLLYVSHASRESAPSPVWLTAMTLGIPAAGGLIGAPLTAVLIVFELTQNFDVATAAMVSVAFANLIGFRMYGRSFFDEQLQSRGFDLSLGRDKVTMQQHTIRKLLKQEYTSGKADNTLIQIRDALIKDKRSEAYIVDSTGTYVGSLTLHRLMELSAAGTALNQAAGPHAEPESLILDPDASIWTAMSEMEGFVGESIPVLEDGRLVGVLFESTIVAAYLTILENIRREENAAV